MTDSVELAAYAPRPAPIMTDDEIARTYRIADGLAKSGIFKDVRQAEQAWGKMLIGRDLGLTPTQALTGIHMIEGKPEVSAGLLAFFVKSRPGYDFRVVEHTDRACELEFFRDGESLGTSRFTLEDAKMARLDGKDNYKKYPRNMFFARALSNGVRWLVPEVTNGQPVYFEGEIEARERDVAGSGDATAEGSLEGVPLAGEVRETVARAAALGHAGLSSLATAEMTLRGQSEERARDWLRVANVELDGMEPADAELAEDEASAGGSEPDRPSGTAEGGSGDGPSPEHDPSADAGAGAHTPAPDNLFGADLGTQVSGTAHRSAEAEVARQDLLRRADSLEANAEACEAQGADDQAGELRAEAAALRDAAIAEPDDGLGP